MAQGPAAGLDALDAIAALAEDSALAGYHLLHRVRGELLMKMGNIPEACEGESRPVNLGAVQSCETRTGPLTVWIVGQQEVIPFDALSPTRCLEHSGRRSGRVTR
jgi:hypothetical protein